jgi:hypothetical protein
MVRSRLKTLAAALSVCALTSALVAQSAPNSVLINPNPPAKPKNDAPARTRVISPEVAAQLQAYAPKYTPPPPKPAPKPEEDLPDAREVDKPRNGIIRLPKYVVQEPKSPVLNERAVNTEKGLKDIAVRRYISEMDRALNGYTLPLFGSSKESRAMAMYAEDERLKNMGEMKDAAVDAKRTDPAQGAYILRQTQDTFMRTSDFGWQGGSPK